MDSSLLPDRSVTNSFWTRFVGSAAIFLRAHYHLHYFGSIEVQVAVTAQGHQAVNLNPIGKLISARDKPDEGDIICKLQELYGLVSGGAALSVHGEGPSVHRCWCTESLSHACQSHMLPPVRQEVSADTWHVSTDELKISVNTADSWSAQYFRIDRDAESGPAALWVFCLFCLQSLFTSLSNMERGFVGDGEPSEGEHSGGPLLYCKWWRWWD